MSPRLRLNLIDIFVHCLVAVVGTAVIYLKSGCLSWALMFVAGNNLIDLDHLIDHFLYFKNKFTLKDFFSSTHLDSGKTYLFFHSWELNFILLFLGLAINSKELLFLALGLIVHLICDGIFNRRFLSYFLLYRMSRGFESKVFPLR